MNRIIKLLFIFMLMTTSCSDSDEVNIVITGIDVSEGFPQQKIQIFFNNNSYTKFDVFFGNRPSSLNSVSNFSPSSNGMPAIVPNVSSEEEVEISLKASGKAFVVPGLFKLKPLPRVTYLSGNECGFRRPIKFVIEGIEYFANKKPQISFCGGTVYCEGPTSVAYKSDTIVVTPSTSYSSVSYAAPFSLKISGDVSFNTNSQTQPINGPTIYFRPTYNLNSYTGKPGDKITVIYDNAFYFGDDMTFKLGDVTVQPSGVDIVTGAGYINALAASYTIPVIPSGTYSISILDKGNINYLPEKTDKFIVQ